MKIKDRPEYDTKPQPLTCSPGDNLRETVKRMAEKNYGACVVVDAENKVLGMITERDIMSRIVAAGRDPDTTRVEDVMTRDVRIAHEEDELTQWLRIMSNERFRRLPIVDDDGRLVNIMTQGDFVSYTWPDLMNQAATLTRSTVSSNYQVFIILGAILLYTIVIVAALGAAMA